MTERMNSYYSSRPHLRPKHEDGSMSEMIERVARERKLREALAFYATSNDFDLADWVMKMTDDGGDVANRAIAETAP